METEKSCASSVDKEKKVIEKNFASSVEEEKKKIFLQVLKSDAGFKYNEFYTIDLHTHQLSECPYALFANPGFNSMVALRSVIFVVGSVIPELIRCKIKPSNSKCTKEGIYHNCFSYLDLTNQTGDGWKEVPCICEGPSPSPCVVAFGDKIYVFRCCKSKTAMVFDPSLNKWETLYPPTEVGFFEIGHTSSAVVDPQNKRILIHFDSIQSVFAYYPDNGGWELILKSFAWSSKLIFVDGVIYFYLPESPELVAAFHVGTKQWLNNVFEPEFSHSVWNYDFDAMIYLGSNLMCLASYTSDNSQIGTLVYLVKFKFERLTHRPADLLLTVFPLETYPIHGRCIVHNFVAI